MLCFEIFHSLSEFSNKVRELKKKDGARKLFVVKYEYIVKASKLIKKKIVKASN